eukprot:5050248-Alexandrium_andersonii.AAC.1
MTLCALEAFAAPGAAPLALPALGLAGETTSAIASGTFGAAGAKGRGDLDHGTAADRKLEFHCMCRDAWRGKMLHG